MSTTKKGKKQEEQKRVEEEQKRVEEEKQKINKIYESIKNTYLSSLPQSTIDKKIREDLIRVADIVGYSYTGNLSPKKQLEVLKKVQENYGIESDLAKIRAQIASKQMIENAGKGSSVASEKRKEVKKFVQEIDDDVDYSKKDEKVIEEETVKIVDKVIEQPSLMQKIIEEGVSKELEKTDKVETKEQEKKIVQLTEELVNKITQVSDKSEQKTSVATQASEKSEQKSSVADAFKGKSTYYNIGTQLPVPKSYKTETPKLIQEERPTLSESMQAMTTQTAEPLSDVSTEPIIERAYVSEQQQMKMDIEEPSSFASQNIFKQVKEGKTKLSDLENNFLAPIQYPDQLLKWINMIGGWEQYKYNRGKFGLIDDVKGDNEYLQNMKSSLIMVCGDDIGIINNEVENINQAVKELMIMKNCYYIYKFKASLPPQYGLIVNANKLMTFADILGKGAKSTEDSSKLDPKLKAQKPVIKGKERIEFEEEKKNLIQQSMENRQGPQRELVPKPDINQDTIHKSQVQRGNRGLLQINMDSFNKRTINQGSLAQADAIARGIKIMKPKKQFGRY